jgi:Subtilase family
MQKRIRSTLGIVFFGFVLVCLGVGMAQQQTTPAEIFQEIFRGNKNLRPGVDYVPNEILVGLPKDLVSKIGLQDIIRKLTPRFRNLGLDLSRIDFPGSSTLPRSKSKKSRICGGVILTLQSTDDIAFFPIQQLDEILREGFRGFWAGAEDPFFIAPNDGHHMPEGSTEIPSDPATQEFEWSRDFQAGDARGVKVAVLDSGFVEIPGVNYDRINGRDFSPGAPTSGNPRDWRVDNIEFIPRNGGPHVYGHGTPVVEAIVRVAQDATILPIKVCNSARCTGRSVTQGLCWASDKQAKVINLSLGGFINSPIVEAATKDAIDAGAIIVAAAGNTRTLSWPDGNPLRFVETWNTPVYPAAWSRGAQNFNAENTEDGIISVTAMAKLLDNNLQAWVSPFGHVGPSVDVMTYGEQVFSRFSLAGLWSIGVSFQDAQRNGTSISAPIIAGAAAVVVAHNSGISPVQVKARILNAGLRYPLICYKTNARYVEARNGCTGGRNGSAPRPIAAENEPDSMVYLLDETRLSTLLR